MIPVGGVTVPLQFPGALPPYVPPTTYDVPATTYNAIVSNSVVNLYWPVIAVTRPRRPTSLEPRTAAGMTTTVNVPFKRSQRAWARLQQHLHLTAIVPLTVTPAATVTTATDYRQHPYWRSEQLQRIMNLTTPRTHQYAVWITIGFFEVNAAGRPWHVHVATRNSAFDILGPEIGAANGKNVRYRGFFLVDRLSLTGFNPSSSAGVPPGCRLSQQDPVSAERQVIAKSRRISLGDRRSLVLRLSNRTRRRIKSISASLSFSERNAHDFPSSSSRIHIDRAAGGDQHHRHSGRAALARHQLRPRGRPARQVPEQHAQRGPRHPRLRQQQERLSALGRVRRGCDHAGQPDAAPPQQRPDSRSVVANQFLPGTAVRRAGRVRRCTVGSCRSCPTSTTRNFSTSGRCSAPRSPTANGCVSYFDATNYLAGQASNAKISNTAIGVLICPDDNTIQTWPGQPELRRQRRVCARTRPYPLGWVGSQLDGGCARRRLPLHLGVDHGQLAGHHRHHAEAGRDVPRVDVRARDHRQGSLERPVVAHGHRRWRQQHDPDERKYADRRQRHGHPVLQRSRDQLGVPAAQLHVVHRLVERLLAGRNDCTVGRAPPGCSRPIGDIDGLGWAFANKVGTFANISGGQSLTIEGQYPFSNSAHPGGCNMGFCDGGVRFISNTIDGTVYAKIITPGGQQAAALLQADARRAGCVRQLIDSSNERSIDAGLPA